MLNPLIGFALLAGSAAVTVLALALAEGAAGGAKVRREERKTFSWHQEARRLRAAELAADPTRAHYAALVEQGEDWSDVNIRYFEDPTETITCVHLEPIERAMRRDGVSARRYHETDVMAACRIHHDALKRDFVAEAPVRYAEFYIGERSERDYPAAFLICDEHKCVIHTEHPEEVGAKAVPWFPRPPDGREA